MGINAFTKFILKISWAQLLCVYTCVVVFTYKHMQLFGRQMKFISLSFLSSSFIWKHNSTETHVHMYVCMCECRHMWKPHALYPFDNWKSPCGEQVYRECEVIVSACCYCWVMCRLQGYGLNCTKGPIYI